MSYKLSAVEYRIISKNIESMKIIHGPEWVNATLRRHKDILLALQDYEKCYIVDLESKLIQDKDN